MARAFILLYDSFGVGAADDAAKYGNEKANTFLHIAESFSLKIPNLINHGLQVLASEAHGSEITVVDKADKINGCYGFAQEQSLGKDTPSGHWEIAGVPVMFEWGYYDFFPDELINAFIHECELPGILCNTHASGTDIINQLGDEHIKTGKPIVYTSADSVFQIACHEQSFGLEKLYHCCEVARRLVDEYNIGRVIARPFVGANGNYTRTANRRDISTPPPAETLLEKIIDAGNEVIAIGKVADIYAHKGISKIIKGDGNLDLFDKLIEATKTAPDKSLTFVNFVDFDSKYGHRRDVEGYAKALEALDARLPEFEALMQANDLAIITADHGCDPTALGTDHTREYIPIMAFGPNIKTQNIGKRKTFADIGQTIATHLQLAALDHGEAWS